MSDVAIRPSAPDDYEAIAQMVNLTNTQVPLTAQALHDSDAQRPDYCKFARWVAKADGQLVGFALFEQSPYIYDPTSVNVLVRVHPEYQGRGMGQQLYAIVEAAALQEGIHTFRSSAIETETRSLEFATRLGYSEEKRVFESTLDVPAFDPTRFSPEMAALAEQGIAIRSYSEVQGKPGLAEAIYALSGATLVDVPTVVPYTLPAFELFCEQTFRNPQVPLEGILLAFAQDDDIVGITYHRAYNAEQMNVNFSGVRRDYRGKGLALALKVAGVQFAQSYGTQILRTTNDSTNPSILAINRKMGFVPRPAFILFKKTIEA